MNKILLLTIVFVVSLFAVAKEQIKPTMVLKIEEITNVLKSDGKNFQREKIIDIMDGIFDFKIMSKISLGRTWKKVSKSDRESFVELFEKKLQDSYLDKLTLYNDEKILITDAKQVKKNRIWLNSLIKAKEQDFKVVYKFYRDSKKNEWYIYDVDIAGVSIIQTYRKQFSEFLKAKSFAMLLDSLK
jgi:phospholipid transport system substrate-binding protein